MQLAACLYRWCLKYLLHHPMQRIAIFTAIHCVFALGSGITIVSADDSSLVWMEVQDLCHGPIEDSDLAPSGVIERRLVDVFEDDHGQREAAEMVRTTSPFRLATMMMQPTPLLEPRISATPSTATIASPPQSLQTRLFTSASIGQSLLRQSRMGVASFAADRVFGSTATSRVTTDVGDLLRKSPAALSVGVQRRTPINNDARIRSSRIDSLAGSGSHWVAARADLDTALSKIDSRLIDEVLLIPGPYSALYGPAFQYIDFQLLKTPRSDDGLQWNGRTAFDFNSNGNQWLGLQRFSGGGENWGIRFDYTHRTGDNYRTGAGNRIAAEYESREFSLALGRDFGDGRSIELSALRLDQTDVDFPGYVFDLDLLMTDAYEITYIDENPWLADRSEMEVWYNRTEFRGNAQDPNKREQFPLLDRLSYLGTTNADTTSTGYRSGHTWAVPDWYSLTVGHDLRFVRQELDEVADATPLLIALPVFNRNSPIPESFSVNPGLFAEYSETLGRQFTLRSGGRLDFVQTDITADASELTNIGLGQFPATYEQIVGTDQKQTDRFLWSLYAALDREFSPHMNGTASVGFAHRPPTLTALYAAQPFLLLLQNGLNNVTGDPTLDDEKMIQADFSLDYTGEKMKFGFRGFYGWGLDYITFENTAVTTGPPIGDVQQVSLRYVNTDLATFVGGEAFAELYPNGRVTPFVTLKGIDGRDRTRNGSFATENGSAGFDSRTFANLPRGSFSGIVGADSESLPGISPFEFRFGVRLRDQTESPIWNVELSARVVDNQDRVATSLLEVPTPGFTTYDLRMTYQPKDRDGLTLVAGVENLFDKAYREHFDNQLLIAGQPFLQPGLNAYMGVDWAY